MRHWEEFDYVIINQDFATAVTISARSCAPARLDALARSARVTRALMRSDLHRPLALKEHPWPASRSKTASRSIPNRFELTLAATNRARQITAGSTPLLDADRDKPTVIALREVAAGKVGIEMLIKAAT